MPHSFTDPYEVLGLGRNATEAEVRAAYLRLVKKHHPDKNPGDKASEWIFKEVQSAYETLREAKEARPGAEQKPPPSRGDQADRDQRDGAAHGHRQQQHSKRPERETHRRGRQRQGQDVRGRSARMRPSRNTRERSPAEPAFRRILRWGKWTVYSSNALLWPAALAGMLEELPTRIEGFAFGWMVLGIWILTWEFVLKDAIKDSVGQFRRDARKRP